MEKLAIGIDIGGTRTKIGLVDLTLGKVVNSIVAPTEKESRELFENKLEFVIKGLINTFNHNVILGIGIGVSGFVWENGTVDSTYGFIKFMEDYPLAEIIKRKFGLACRVDNDARTAALGEALYGQGKGYERLLMLTLGTGLGLGFTRHGKLTEELPFAHMGGHLTINENGAPCYCGKTGCLESLVSATGIIDSARRAGWRSSEDLPLTTESIFEAANQGQPEAEIVVKQWIAHLKTGIDNYINIYAPDIIVLGGGVVKGLRNYISFLETDNILRPYKNYRVKISISVLEERAGILGSAALFND